MSQTVAQIDNGDVRVRAIQATGEIVEEFAARDAKGVYHTILVSPTHPEVGHRASGPKPNLLRGDDEGLFDAPPSFGFSRAEAKGRSLTLTTTIGLWAITKKIELPEHGNTIEISVTASTPGPYPQIRYLLDSYAFLPGKPDETWAPALRPEKRNVIGDHFFRAPAAILRKGSLAATLMPDLDVMRDNRPIPTILDLDVANGVVTNPLLSFGFCDHTLTAHVRFSNDSSMVKPVPWKLDFREQICLDADATAGSATHKATDYMWSRYGHRYFQKPLPQVMSFADYARLCYPAAFSENATGGWFERTIDGHVCGGVPSGWGLDQGWVSWQCWFNQLRSAWGLRWWGKRLGEKDWVERADKMLNLALAAPSKDGMCTSTYLSRSNEWKGSLITPSGDCYYDVPSIAWKGIWLIRWLQIPDCPRRQEVEVQVDAIWHGLKRIQASDGSFPSWLSPDLKPVPVLDRSAQSALPVWFIEELAAYKQKSNPSFVNEALPSIRSGAKFLAEQIVPKALYYDFETFFSCSPKQCLQRSGVLDDLKMWDPHTMQPPQNTLSMQWAAEALFRAQAGHELAAQQAFDTMIMYQVVWPISYRPVAYTYGSFGVQNSDGEYNDARQAQFGATLCDFGATLRRQDLFERGVAAVRASLALVNVPGNPRAYPNPNYPPGLEPENCGHGGLNEQDGRTGFDWGEGSGLAAAAEIIEKYGDSYRSPQNWSVMTNPSSFSFDDTVTAPLADPIFEFSEPTLSGWSVDGTMLRWPTRSTRMDFGNQGHPFLGTCEDGRGGFDDTYTGTMVSPPFVTGKPTIHLLVGGGSGDGVGVELLDESDHQVAVARGKNVELMAEVVWHVPSGLQGKPLRIRVFDHETGPWGHINVGRIWCE